MTPAPANAQARVLRRLFLTLMVRGRRQRQGRPSRVQPWIGFSLGLGFFALVGLIALSFPRGYFFIFAGLLHSFAFLMAGMNLAVSSGQLLFNPEEADVLLHRPIQPRALLRAKLQTVGFTSFSLAVAISVGGLIAGVQEVGWLFVPVHLVALGLEISFCAGFVVLAYNLSLRWFGRERLDNLMTAVQVTLAVTVMIGGQVLPRLLRSLDFTQLHFPLWMDIFPPVWFAALDLLLLGDFTTPGLVLPATIGVVATALTAWFGVDRLAATYEQGLEALNEAGPGATHAGGHGRWIERLRHFGPLRWWLRDPVEAAAFRLTLANLGRSRGVKLRVYPMLAQVLVYPIIIFTGGIGASAGPFMQAYLVAYVGYFVAMLPVLVLDRLRLSEDCEAAAIFQQAPLARPTALFQGTRKGVIVALCLPGLLLVLLAGAILLPDKSRLCLILPGLLALAPFSLLSTLFGIFVPFSEPVEGATRGFRTTALVLFFQFLSFGLAALAAWLWDRGDFRWLLLGHAVLAVLLTAGLRAIIRGQRFAIED